MTAPDRSSEANSELVRRIRSAITDPGNIGIYPRRVFAGKPEDWDAILAALESPPSATPANARAVAEITARDAVDRRAIDTILRATLPEAPQPATARSDHQSMAKEVMRFWRTGAHMPQAAIDLAASILAAPLSETPAGGTAKVPEEIQEWIWHLDLHLTEHDDRHARMALRAAWPVVRGYFLGEQPPAPICTPAHAAGLDEVERELERRYGNEEKAR